MASGVALEDADRWPWLERLNAELRKIEHAGRSAVLACSALKEAYRQRLTQQLRAVRIVYLHGSFELIHRRLAERRHRYMPASLLRSQFEALEPPGDAIAVDVSAEPAACVAAAAAALRAGAQSADLRPS
jgi:carbohydrate kinase (thermoresistant glucokinase family)